MAYEIKNTEHGLILELSAEVTVRDAGELTRRIASALASADSVVLRTAGLEDIDTSILQILISLRKTVASFTFDDPSEFFISAVDRCALRRELLAGAQEAA